MGWKHYMVAKARERQKSILDSLPGTQAGITKATKLPASTVHRNLLKLVEDGLVESFGSVENPHGGPAVKLYRKKVKND